MNPTEKISKHLTIGDAIKSETAIRKGIDNSIPPALLVNAKNIAVKVFDPIKDKFPSAGAYSFFRSKALNLAVGGSQNSFHSFAGALDIDTPGNEFNRAIFKWVLEGNVPFSELIWEFGDLNAPDWVHVGYLEGYPQGKILHIWNDPKTGKQRQVLTKEQAIAKFKL
jgi:hypothetical protein